MSNDPAIVDKATLDYFDNATPHHDVGVEWLNIAQPVVSYYTPDEVRDFVGRSDLAEVESTRAVESPNLAWVIAPSLTFVIVRRAIN
jgi:hypothetical protein